MQRLRLTFPSSLSSHYSTVGTHGYTAPEVLKGQHYGTPADVFSFAIVMSEVVTLSPPYADMITGENRVSLSQIAEMTKPPTNIRPTVGCFRLWSANSNAQMELAKGVTHRIKQNSI